MERKRKRGRPPVWVAGSEAVRMFCYRVGRGETVKAVCAREGMPDVATVWRLRRRDPAFDRAVAAAIAKGEARRQARRGFDPATAEALLARLEGAEPIKTILRDPAMPGWRDYLAWRRENAEFAWRVNLATRRRRRQVQRRNHPRRRPFDPVVGERMLLGLAKGGTLKALRAADPAIPGYKVLLRWRREAPDFGRDLDMLVRMGPHVRCVIAARARGMAVAEQVAEGLSLREIAAQPGMPDPSVVRRWAKLYPDVREALRKAADFRDDALGEEILELAAASGPRADGAARRMAALYNRMRRGRTGAPRLPKGLPWMADEEADETGDGGLAPGVPPRAGAPSPAGTRTGRGRPG